ncbi:HPP family protein [Bradyrhizobium sp. AZCC 1708]|uniref:HPP family protein n=1 Tax=Bradyrhizobium sp. AZCC 1708 TaxID=3117015 RepID=UPI002FEFF74A
MKRDWRRAAYRAISRNDHRNVLAGAVAGLGGAIAIGVMEWFSFAAHYPLAVIPFATSIVLVIGSLDVAPAQPRALIGGHVVSALVGLIVLKLTGPQAWAAAAAVGLSILAMYVTGDLDGTAGLGSGRRRRPFDSGDVRHRDLSPAGRHQPAAGGLRQSALDVPARAVVAGALLLTAFSYIWHRWVRRQPWPRRWL